MFIVVGANNVLIPNLYVGIFAARGYILEFQMITTICHLKFVRPTSLPCFEPWLERPWDEHVLDRHCHHEMTRHTRDNNFPWHPLEASCRAWNKWSNPMMVVRRESANLCPKNRRAHFGINHKEDNVNRGSNYERPKPNQTKRWVRF